MGRKIRTFVPVIPSQFNPGCTEMEKLKKTEQAYRQKQKLNYNQRHRARDLSCLHPGEHVWIRDTME